MDFHGCPRCHALRALLAQVEPDVVRRGVEARARGSGFGLLVTVPKELGAETEEEEAELEAARAIGYYVGVLSVDELIQLVPAIEGCVAAVTARADPELAAARDLDAARERRIAELLSLAEPLVLRWVGVGAQPAGSVFMVAGPPESSADVYVGLLRVAEAIARLPLENLEAEDALRATRRLTEPIPDRSVRVVAVHDGQITVVTAPAGPGCLALHRVPRDDWGGRDGS